MMDPELRARVLAAARRQPSPSRAQVLARTTPLVASAVAVPVALFVAVGAVRTGARPSALLAATACGALAIALAALWTAVGRGGQMIGRSRGQLVAMSLLAPAAFFVWKLGWSERFAHMADAVTARPGYRCLALTLLLAAWPFAVLALLRRGSDPTHPRALGAAVGVASGTAAGVLVDLWCPVGYPGHLLLGHLAPIALLGVAGVLVGQRLIALRRPD
jgi:hypothetical protein